MTDQKNKRGRPRTFEKETVLETAMHLFWRHGYDGTSISMLADSMGIKPASLYAAFGNKEQLYFAAVDHYGQLYGNMYQDALALPTAREVAEALMIGEVNLVTRRGTPDGCLVMNSALVASPESERISEIMSKVRTAPHEWIKARFDRAKQEGDLPPEANSDALARYILTLLTGIASQAKSGIKKAKLMAMVRVALLGWPYPGNGAQEGNESKG